MILSLFDRSFNRTRTTTCPGASSFTELRHVTIIKGNFSPFQDDVLLGMLAKKLDEAWDRFFHIGDNLNIVAAGLAGLARRLGQPPPSIWNTR